MSSKEVAIAAIALGAGCCIGLAANAEIPHYGSSFEVPVTLVLVVLGYVLFSGPKKKGAAAFPATSWPAGKPVMAKPSDYPTYDHEKDAKGSFMKINDMLIEEVKAELPAMYQLPERENAWINDMLEYNTKGGKMTRGLMVVETGKVIFRAKGLPVDNTALCKFAVLGWCIEWLQAWLLVADDIMDESVTRRGQSCWYKCKGVGHIAINDAVTIEALVFKILKRHLCASPQASHHHPCYRPADDAPPLRQQSRVRRLPRLVGAAGRSRATRSWST